MSLPPKQNLWQGLTDHEGQKVRLALRSFILGLTKDIALTDDVIQETLIRTSKSVCFSELDNPLAYMITVAKSVLYDFQRKKPPHPVDYQSVSLDAANDCPEQRYLDQQKLAFIEMALNDMSPLRREVFLLRRIEGLSRDAIAEQLELSVEAVKKHLTRAMVELTMKLEDGGWTDLEH